MTQPRKKIKKEKEEETNFGIDYCDECFMFVNGYCNASDVKLPRKSNVKVPDWCGNKRK